MLDNTSLKLLLILLFIGIKNCLMVELPDLFNECKKVEHTRCIAFYPNHYEDNMGGRGGKCMNEKTCLSMIKFTYRLNTFLDSDEAEWFIYTEKPAVGKFKYISLTPHVSDQSLPDPKINENDISFEYDGKSDLCALKRWIIENGELKLVEDTYHPDITIVSAKVKTKSIQLNEKTNKSIMSCEFKSKLFMNKPNEMHKKTYEIRLNRTFFIQYKESKADSFTENWKTIINHRIRLDKGPWPNRVKIDDSVFAGLTTSKYDYILTRKTNSSPQKCSIFDLIIFICISIIRIGYEFRHINYLLLNV